MSNDQTPDPTRPVEEPPPAQTQATSGWTFAQPDTEPSAGSGSLDPLPSLAKPREHDAAAPPPPAEPSAAAPGSQLFRTPTYHPVPPPPATPPAMAAPPAAPPPTASPRPYPEAASPPGTYPPPPAQTPPAAYGSAYPPAHHASSPPSPPPGYAPYGAQAPASTNTSALVLLIVSAVLTLSCYFTLAGLPALIMAIIAMNKQSSDPEGSRRLARHGWITLGAVSAFSIVAVIIIGVVASLNGA